MALKVGIQLYSVRNEMEKNPVKTIEGLAKIGYTYIEAANHNAEQDFGVGFGIEAEKLKQVLDQNGVSIISSHINPINDHNFEAITAYNHKIGNQYIVCPMAFFEGYDQVMRFCEQLDKLGAKLKQEGFHYLYHNHFHEFQQFKGKTVLEYMMENTDPMHLGFELDTFWALRGGQEVTKLMEHLGNRLKIVHQKDYNQAAGRPVSLFDQIDPEKTIDMEVFGGCVKEDEFAEIGTGCMNIQEIIDKANELNCVEYLVLEQDHSKLPQLESVAASFENLHKYNGLTW